MSQNFSLVNHGFVYLCLIDDGTYWIRSVSGKWAQISTKPLDTLSLQADLDAFLVQGVLATENDVKVDDASQIIVEPKKVDPSTKDISPDTPLDVDPVFRITEPEDEDESPVITATPPLDDNELSLTPAAPEETLTSPPF